MLGNKTEDGVFLIINASLWIIICIVCRKDDKQRSSIAKPSGPTSHSSDRGSGERPTARKRDPPPVPVKTYSLKEIDMDHVKARNYENSNR